MKAKLFLTAVLLMGVFVLPTQAEITGVTIFPENPLETDLISFDIFGTQPTGSVTVTDTAYSISENEITMDLFLNVGFAQWATPWDYTYDVGLLSAGTYDLTVNTIIADHPSANDTFTTSFEVIPEPTTFLLVGTGLYGIRRIRSAHRIANNQQGTPNNQVKI
jgi:hypothetical protein